MVKDISININSILGSLAIIAFLVLLFGISYKYYTLNFKLPDNVFVGAAIVFGFAISIGIYVNTDFGLLFCLALGSIPAFILLGLITPIGWIFLILDILVLIIIVIVYYLQEYYGGI